MYDEDIKKNLKEGNMDTHAQTYAAQGIAKHAGMPRTPRVRRIFGRR